VAAAWGLEADDLRWFVEPDPATRATPSLSGYATWVSTYSMYRIAGWSTASSRSPCSEGYPRPPTHGHDLFQWWIQAQGRGVRRVNNDCCSWRLDLWSVPWLSQMGLQQTPEGSVGQHSNAPHAALTHVGAWSQIETWRVIDVAHSQELMP
jgi:hypothetical protein